MIKLVAQCCLKIFRLDYYVVVSPVVEHIKNHGVWYLCYVKDVLTDVRTSSRLVILGEGFYVLCVELITHIMSKKYLFCHTGE